MRTTREWIGFTDQVLYVLSHDGDEAALDMVIALTPDERVYAYASLLATIQTVVQGLSGGTRIVGVD